MFSPHTRTAYRRIALAIFAMLAMLETSSGQLLDWDAAIAANANQSTFTTVEATVEGPGGGPAVLLAGHFTGNFSFGPTPMLANALGQDGIVALLQPDALGAWDVTWKLQAESTPGTISINDLVVDDGGTFYICGTYSGDADFGSISLPTVTGAPQGFIAWGDPDPTSPSWLGAFAITDILPESIATEEDGATGVYVTGPGPHPGDLAQRYDLTGNTAWLSPAPLPNNDTQPSDIVFGHGPGGPVVYVFAEDSGGSSTENLVLYQLDTLDGTSNWERRLGNSNTNNTGGLGLTPLGDVALAFSSDDPAVSLNAAPLPGLVSLTGTQAMMLQVDPLGNLLWSRPLGLMTANGGSMLTSDLAIDQAGNTFVSAVQSGPFNVAGISTTANQDTVIIGVDGAGELFEYQASTGNSPEIVHAISAPTRDLLIAVGDYGGNMSQFGNISLPNAASDQGFIAISTPVMGQSLFILEPVLPFTTSQLRQAIQGQNVGGQIYLEIDRDGIPFAFSAYLTDDQLIDLTNSVPAGSFIFEPDAFLTLNGTTSSSGWALGHLNDAASAAPTYSYTYPDTTETVYVYLIDTAVGSDDGMVASDLATWFGGNTNLTFETTTLIRGTGDPIVSSVFEHGTKMASLVAGPETGSGVGVPIVIKNFDFYPNGVVTTAGLLADAIDAAMVWHEANAECSPGVIVIASGSVASVSSSTITSYLKRARDDYHLASVISAGNEAGDTASYTPSENGSEAGIICTAASTETEGVLAASNEGIDVDLYAPGDGVRVVNFSSPTGGGYDSSTGTSASAALTCGVATIHLSMNPWLTPEDLETELIADTASVGVGLIDVLEVETTGPEFTGDYDMWAEFHFLTDDAHSEDDDGDGWTNLDEYFYGLNPCGDDTVLDPLNISYDESTGDYTVAFKLNSVLVDSSAPSTLLDGSTLEITDSTDAISFTGPGGIPTIGSTSAGRTDMSYTAGASSSKDLFRLEITPSTPSP